MIQQLSAAGKIQRLLRHRLACREGRRRLCLGVHDLDKSDVERGGQGNLFNAVPTSARVLNGPWTSRQTFRKLGIFAQDQWTLDRFTINAGVRFDGHIGSVPGDENVSGPSRWAARQTWVDIDDVPNWKDISPRVGLAYDLFGNSRTALKFSASRYVVNEGTAFAQSVNPLFFNQQSNRSWADRNGDYIPQDDELGPHSNRNFATAVRNVTSDDAIREGWGVRQYNLGVQRRRAASSHGRAVGRRRLHPALLPELQRQRPCGRGPGQLR